MECMTDSDNGATERFSGRVEEIWEIDYSGLHNTTMFHSPALAAPLSSPPTPALSPDPGPDPDPVPGPGSDPGARPDPGPDPNAPRFPPLIPPLPTSAVIGPTSSPLHPL
nr:tetra-peptide repeat homeobox protein 1-like [Aegilops tauschii subsp. strangulata]